MNNRIFRIVTIFRKSHPIFLDLSESGLYLVSLFYNPRSDEISQKSKQVNYILSKNIEDGIRMIFGFSLYSVFL